MLQERHPSDGDSANAAVPQRMRAQRSDTDQDSPPAPLTSPNSPFDALSPPDRLLGAARPFPCGWLFLTVAMATAPAGRRREGRGPKLLERSKGSRYI